MGCPYTAVKNYFQKLTAIDFAVMMPLDIQRVRTDYNIRIIGEMNQVLSSLSVNSNAASTVRGSREVTVYPEDKTHDIAKRFNGEVHGVMRGLVGNLGKKLDKKSLPETVQTELKNLKTVVKEYRQTTEILKVFYADNGTGDAYDDLEGLVHNIGKKNCEVELDRLYDLDEQSQIIIDRLAMETAEVKSYHLIGDDQEIANQTDGPISDQVSWYLYAEMAAQVFMDTVRVPPSLKEAIQDNISATSGIIERYQDQVKHNPEMMTPAILEVYDRAIDKMGMSFHRCGNFEEFAAHRAGKRYLKAMQIENKNDFDAMAQDVTTIRKPKEMSNGVCPMGFGRSNNPQ